MMAEVITTSTKPRKRRRVALWSLIIWTVLMAVWIIAGIAGQDTGNCGSLDAQTCQDATDVGTGIGVALLVGLWMFGVFVIAAITVIVRLARRD